MPSPAQAPPIVMDLSWGTTHGRRPCASVASISFPHEVMPTTSTVPADSSISKISSKARTSSLAEGVRQWLRKRCEMSFRSRTSPAELWRPSLRTARYLRNFASRFFLYDNVAMLFAHTRVSLVTAPDDLRIASGALQSAFGKLRQFSANLRRRGFDAHVSSNHRCGGRRSCRRIYRSPPSCDPTALGYDYIGLASGATRAPSGAQRWRGRSRGAIDGAGRELSAARPTDPRSAVG